MRTSLWTYPWDVLDEGVDQAVAAIAHGGGFNGISLAASYHATKALLPHNPKRKVYFGEDSVVYFRTRPERYGKLRPRPSALLDGADPFALVGDACERRGIDLHAWVICCHGTPLGLAHPELSLQNAFGDRLLHSLCPSQPDVRRYVVGLISDLATFYPIRSAELEACEFMDFRHGFHHEKLLTGLTAFESWLMSLCFCEACAARAKMQGVDPEPLRREVVRRLEVAFGRDAAPVEDKAEAAGWLAADPDFAAYARMREQTVRSLVGEIKDAVSPSRNVALLCFADVSGGWQSGTRPEHLTHVADGFLSGYYASSAAALDGLRALRRLAGTKPVYGAVSATHPAASGAREVAERIRAYATTGIDGINVYNYGLSPLAYLRAAQEALASLRTATTETRSSVAAQPSDH